MHGLPRSEAVSLNGWAAHLTFNVTRRLGVAASFSGVYGSSPVVTVVTFIGEVLPGESTPPLPPIPAGPSRLSVMNHSLLIGPEFRLVQNRRTIVRLTAGLGAARATPDSQVSVFAYSPNYKPALPGSNGLAMGAGLSADVRLTEHLAYRALQFRWIAGNFDFGWQRSLQLATGLVVNFGR